MRINKFIASTGYCSRRKADEIISEGRVMLNGERVLEFGIQVNEDDYIEIDGELITQVKKHEYYVFRKPKNIITSVSDDRNRQTVVDFFHTDARIFPVGRLDYQSTGVLLLTTDGDFSQMLTHPKFKIPKVYHVTISSPLSNQQLDDLRNGIVIDGLKTQKCEISILEKKPKMQLEITLFEGRNRQIRKMMEYFNVFVRKLDRKSYAFISYKGLNPGDYRQLTKKEIRNLKEMAK
jgi:23S rRNA pseudouridine2605 synthase